MNKVIVLKELLSISRRVLFHRISMLYDLLYLLGWRLFFLASCTSKCSLVVERDLSLLLRGSLGATKVMEPSEVREAKRWWHAHHTS